MFDSLPMSPSVLVLLVGGGLLLGAPALLGRVPLTYNLRNLVVRWRITALTGLAFTLVVGLLMVMLAFVNGMVNITERAGQPGNVIVLSNGATDELMSNLPAGEMQDVEVQPGILRDERGRPLCSWEVYVAVAQPLPVAPGERPRRRLIQMRGLDEPETAARIRALDLIPGGCWFSEAGVREMKVAGTDQPLSVIETVLGEAVAGEWGLSVGDVFDLGDRKGYVVGVLRSAGSPFGSEIWAKRQIIGPAFGKEQGYTSLLLRTAGKQQAAAVAEELTHRFKKAAVQAQPEKEYYHKLAQTTEGLFNAAYIVAIVMAVGGIFGVMNTMFAAVSQRGRDIGVLRLLGFSRWQVLASFFLESVVIALLGGGLGCGLSFLIHGRTATSFLSGKSMTFTLHIDPDLLALGLLFSLAMGALGGLLPSVSAMRIKPLAALR